MTLEYAFGLFLLALSMVWTPGPNNALLANSGARFGYLRSVPHIFGVAIGFPVMMLLIALGLGGLFKNFPLLREILRYAGATILLWLAWKILTSSPPSETVEGDSKPWSFVRAAAFQWINPKAWVMAISIVGQLPETNPFWLSAFFGAGLFLIAGVSSANGWALFGKGMQQYLHTPLRYRVFASVMTGLIVMTVVAILLADLSAH